VATRSAAWRAVHAAGTARTLDSSPPRRTAATQRRSVAHPLAAVVPTIPNGLTRRRTSAALWRAMPNSAIARPIAHRE
jgi:hypothetical protein